jgi:integrase
MLHRALADAVAWRYLADNPATYASLPRQRRARHTTGATWTPEQLAAWLGVAVLDHDAAMWVLVATTGMRRSELAGAVRRLVDLDERTLTKADTRVVVGGKAEDSDGKTASSNHTIALDIATVDYLRKHHAMLDEQSRNFGQGYDDRGWLFCHLDGTPLHPETITRRFNKLVDRAGVPRIRLHDVRHTCATIALDSGVDLKIVSERLGHANMTVTAQIYTHKSTGNDAAAAARIAEMICNPSART